MADEKAKETKESKETKLKEVKQKPAEIKETKPKAVASKPKSKRKIVAIGGRVYVKSSFNNTIITITDDKGNVINWASSGSSGFKGTKKGTPFAAQIASSNCAKKAVEMGLKQVAVFVSGPGNGRETAIRALQSSGLTITFIKDITPIPHNGCRPPKQRRV